MLPACKPGSVECCHSDGHSSRSTVTHALEQPTRSVFNRGGPPLAAYLALLPLGFAAPQLLPAVRWALTPPFHPCLSRRQSRWPSAVYSLLHCPSMPLNGTAQVLPGSVPAGARTFLEHLHARDHPADNI